MHMASTTTSVLTVEDDPIVRVDLRLVLESAGFEVCADARDGVEAVELAREHEPDVILLDLGLPRLSGVDATRMILAERDVPIVALTGRSAAHADEAVNAGRHVRRLQAVRRGSGRPSAVRRGCGTKASRLTQRSGRGSRPARISDRLVGEARGGCVRTRACVAPRGHATGTGHRLVGLSARPVAPAEPVRCRAAGRSERERPAAHERLADGEATRFYVTLTPAQASFVLSGPTVAPRPHSTRGSRHSVR